MVWMPRYREQRQKQICCSQRDYVQYSGLELEVKRLWLKTLGKAKQDLCGPASFPVSAHNDTLFVSLYSPQNISLGNLAGTKGGWRSTENMLLTDHHKYISYLCTIMTKILSELIKGRKGLISPQWKGYGRAVHIMAARKQRNGMPKGLGKDISLKASTLGGLLLPQRPPL